MLAASIVSVERMLSAISMACYKHGKQLAPGANTNPSMAAALLRELSTNPSIATALALVQKREGGREAEETERAGSSL